MIKIHGCALVFGLALMGCGGNAPTTTTTDAGATTDTPAADTAAPDTGATDASVTDVPAADVPAADVPAADVPPAMFTLTSTAYMEGGAIPVANACTMFAGGTNASPALAWTGAPAGTMSFALFFKDQTTAFRHSAIYDIPSTLTGLPANVMHAAMPSDVPGARQPRGYPGTPGYAGPCPGNRHTYRWTLYAIDVANLTDLTATSSLAAVEAAFMAHSLGTATLTATFTPP
jgi:Raf kinase inhibitor-like YbhB/YbcL family protein